MSSGLRRALAAFGALAVAVLIGWASAVVLRPAPSAPPVERFTTATVVPGDVEESIRYDVTARWTRSAAGVNRASGVVTSVPAMTGSAVTAGQVLYTVALRPVVVAEGGVPSFRDLAQGTMGEDVAQLQRLLRASGHSRGRDDGVFTRATSNAVRTWQRALGVPQDGVVRAGDLVFVPTLPARLVVDRQVVAPGMELGGGETVVEQLSDAPDFALTVAADQAARTPSGTAVEVQAPDDSSTWAAQVLSSTPQEDDSLLVTLGPREGSTICGDSCDLVTTEGDSLLRGRVVTQPLVQGLTVPVAALASTADGEVFVVDAGGEQRPVEVTASVGGVAVVEGVPAGTEVRVPAPEPA